MRLTFKLCKRLPREKITHLFDWHKSSLSEANWVSHVKIVRKNQVPSTGSFTYLYDVEHIDVFKKPSIWTRLPTEVVGSDYASLVLQSKVGREYLMCGGGTYWHSSTGHVQARENESRMLERWEDLTESYVEELKDFLRSSKSS